MLAGYPIPIGRQPLVRFRQLFVHFSELRKTAYGVFGLRELASVPFLAHGQVLVEQWRKSLTGRFQTQLVVQSILA